MPRRDDEPVGPRPWHGSVWGRPAPGPARARDVFGAIGRPVSCRGTFGNRRRGTVRSRPGPGLGVRRAGVGRHRPTRPDRGRRRLCDGAMRSAFITLLFAPVYPRESYYGSADIAPESGDRAAVWRRHLMVATPLVVLVAVALVGDVRPTHRAGGAGMCTCRDIVFVVAGSKQNRRRWIRTAQSHSNASSAAVTSSTCATSGVRDRGPRRRASPHPFPI